MSSHGIDHLPRTDEIVGSASIQSWRHLAAGNAVIEFIANCRFLEEPMKSLAGAWLPHEITSEAIGTTDLVGWLTRLGQDDLTQLLAERKALVFRGFGETPESIEPVLDQVVPHRLPYVHGNSPRTKVGGNLYTSTEYPQEFTISMHNEMSYAHHWPKRLVFFCEIAPKSGGATPVVDGELWLNSLDDEIREAFAGGVRYVQNLHDGYGFGKSWMDTFE